MEHRDLAMLKANAVPIPATATRSHILRSVAAMIKAIGTARFKSLTNVERPLNQLRAMPVAGTVMEAVSAALEAGGRPACTTIGQVMDEVPINQAEMNRALCYCNQGEFMTGNQAADNLLELAGKAA